MGGRPWTDDNRKAAMEQRQLTKKYGAFSDISECVRDDSRKQFVIACKDNIVSEFRNGAAALIRLRELGSGHILFDRVSRKIIAHI